jgi:membrane dipeptidase
VDEQLNEHPEYWPPSEYAEQGPSKVAGPDQLLSIAAGLLQRGWSEGDTRKVLGENFLRVARAVWR